MNGVDLARFTQRATQDFASFQRKAGAAHERAKDQPVGDAYRMTFVPPRAWGAVTERIEATYKGLKAVYLRFANHGPIWQLQVPVRGFDI
ncbi:hypothetical protein FRZ61_33030 [Hypericibacter adhaerens]|uniref:Uncharacterized protein n=1 Tax=Hypericibacter adhaerens TaxID=2602016 RepID=A0A5J6N2Z6_9PROT|nr:hypothetical protein [Hypericibacter adhaerens]QEX23365.1 hypothetical protein FRZ61_33030 [Hypericibacter adhaerens]